MRSGNGWPRCCHPNIPRWAAHPTTTGGSWRPSRGSCGPARRGATCPPTTAPGPRCRAASTTGAARASGIGCWWRCRPRPTRPGRWTGCCITWTAAWSAPTSTPPGRAAVRPKPTKKGITHAQDEALGRSRGGYSTKLHLRIEGGGKPMTLTLTGGQRHEVTQVQALLAGPAIKRPGPGGPTGRPGRGRPRIRPTRIAGDKGYSFPVVRARLRRRGIGVVIPAKSNQPRQPRFDKAAYRERNRVERCFNRLKQYRRVATRYEKRAVNYKAMVPIAMIMLWT